MAFHLTLSEGPHPGRVRPIMVTLDPRAIAAVRQALGEILDGAESKVTPLPSRRRPTEAPAETPQAT